MKPTHSGLALAAALLLALAALVAAPHGPDGGRAAELAEVARIRAHLERVERDLRARDVTELTPAQRAARARHLDALREYRQRGIFPHNHDFEDRTPYFVDAHGTHCAVAYLIARSGRVDLVRRVAATANNAYIPKLASDPELVTWLERNGLTAEEAARIQPAYEPRPIESPARDGASAPYVVASLATDAVAGVAMAYVLAPRHERRSPWWGGLGVAAGAAGVALGAAEIGSDHDATRLLAALDLGVGAASTVLGLRTLLGGRDAPATSADPTARDRFVLTAAPLLSPVEGPGVLVRLRF